MDKANLNNSLDMRDELAKAIRKPSDPGASTTSKVRPEHARAIAELLLRLDLIDLDALAALMADKPEDGDWLVE
jgi:hypothetical protein